MRFTLGSQYCHEVFYPPLQEGYEMKVGEGGKGGGEGRGEEGNNDSVVNR